MAFLSCMAYQSRLQDLRGRGGDHMSQPQIPYVMLDGEEIRLTEVEFLNVEEDIGGRDLSTFMYEGETHQSYVVHRPC